MTLSVAPRRHRFPVSIISQAVWIYHRFNNSYRRNASFPFNE
nr:hypothetical protein [Candidatus Paracaedibacter symbiosus]